MTTLDGHDSKYELNTVDEAIQELRAGKTIILLDREDRENEGDLVFAAEFATPENVNLMVKHGRGLICVPLVPDRLRDLELPLMVARNTESHQTAFTVSCDLIAGNTTGISAADRARTIRALIDPTSKPSDFARPGHIFPLEAKPGGVLVRTGQTEGSVDLCRLAGLRPGAAICEILNDDGSMARMPDLVKFAKQHDLALITVPQIIDFRRRHEQLVSRKASYDVDTEFGAFKLVVYANSIDDRPLLALVKGDMDDAGRPPLIRVQVEDALSDGLAIRLPDGRGTTYQAMKMISQYGNGVILRIFDANRMAKLDSLLPLLNPSALEKPTPTYGRSSSAFIFSSKCVAAFPSLCLN